MYLYFHIVYKKKVGQNVQIFGLYGFVKLHLYEMAFGLYYSDFREDLPNCRTFTHETDKMETENCGFSFFADRSKSESPDNQLLC